MYRQCRQQRIRMSYPRRNPLAGASGSYGPFLLAWVISAPNRNGVGWKISFLPYSTRWRNSQVAAESVASAITASGQSNPSTIDAGMSLRNTPLMIAM